MSYAKEVVDRAMQDPVGYVSLGEDNISAVLREFEIRGFMTFEVNGKNYSPEALEELVTRVELDLKNGKTTNLAVGVDLSESWVREQANRLVPYTASKGFFLISC